MILSDREIRAALARHALRITPDPPAQSWTSTAVDLRLAKELVLWKAAKGKRMVCPFDAEYDYEDVKERFSRQLQMQQSGYVIKPQTFLLGWTIEKLQLPYQSRLAARVEGKSSLARLGIGVHVTAPTIHAGFGYARDNEQYPGSPLQLEIWNIGPL